MSILRGCKTLQAANKGRLNQAHLCLVGAPGFLTSPAKLDMVGGWSGDLYISPSEKGVHTESETELSACTVINPAPSGVALSLSKEAFWT